MLRLTTFGGLAIHREDAPPGAGATQRRRLALLALLTRAGERGLTRDKLLGYLWPESEPDKARNVLAQALYALRRDLGADQLFLGTNDLRINPAVLTSDVAEFEAAVAIGRLGDAAALYRGPFLDGVYVNDAPEFERWAETERSVLAGEYVKVLSRLAAEADANGDRASAVGWWRKLVAAEPLSPTHAAGLMRAMAAAGDRSGAIKHAVLFERLTREELGAEPDPEIMRLAETLRRSPSSLRPAPSPAAGMAPSTMPSAEVPLPITDRPASPAAKRNQRSLRRYALAAVAIASLAAVGALGLWSRGLDTDALHPSGRKMIAVLPFQNLGPADEEYFADGLTEEITSRLAAIKGLGVISRTSSMQYKRTDKSLRQIARELAVDYVLEGSVRWEHTPGGGGSRVRVTPQLIQVSDDSHLWADQYDAELADVFGVQGKIAEEVSRALDVTLSGRERGALVAHLTDSLGAYDAYLRGNVLLDRAWGDDSSLRSAVQSYTTAVQRDPGFAAARARLAMAEAMVFRLLDNTPAQLQRAKAQADSTLRLAPELAEAHTALGYYWYWGRRDFAKASEEFTLALERRPNDPDVLSGIGAVERRRGHWDEAVVHLRRAADLDPRSSDKAWNAALALLFLRDYSSSERYLDRAIALSPNWAFPYGTKADLYLAREGDVPEAVAAIRRYPVGNLSQLSAALGSSMWLLWSDSSRFAELDRLRLATFGDTSHFYHLRARWLERRGETAAARAAWDSMGAVFRRKVGRPSDEPYVGMAIAYAHLGRKAEALQAMARAESILPSRADAAWGPDRAFYFVEIYSLLGATDSAVAVTRRLLATPSRLSVARLRVDPLWTPLRRDPRFQALLAALEGQHPSKP